MRRITALALLSAALLVFAPSAPAGASARASTFAVENGFASYQPGGGSTTPTPVQFDVLTLASGGTASASTLSITGQPASGSASANTSNGIVTYTPTASTAGTQTVTFQLCEASSTNCQTATLTEGPAVTVNNAFVIPLVGGYDHYDDIAYGASAPSSVGSGSTFTMWFAPAAITLPGTVQVSTYTATLNYLAGLDYILPVPANATYVSGSAQVVGGDANTNGHATVSLCDATGGATTCTATASSSTFPTDTTTPYLELQLSSSLHVPGGTQVTVPSVVAQFKASGAASTSIEPQVTEFDAEGNVTISGLVTDYSAALDMYPVSPSFISSAATAPPAYYAYPLSTTSVTAPVEPPDVTGVSPASGPQAGGTSVKITGSNLANASAVSFGGVTGKVTADTSGSITVTTPAVAAPRTVDVTVTTPGGTSAKNPDDEFTYLAPAPSISGIAPASGPQAGATAVTISGSNLEDATAVDFGSSPATVTSDAGGSIIADSPPGSGTVAVTVTTASGTATSPTQFTYVAPPPPPSITGIAPGTGPAPGGTPVTISGTNLANATAVDFGTVAATITSDSATSIVAESPPQLGAVSVTVTTPGGTASAPTQFVYTIPPGFPTVTSLSATGGPVWGGTSVTVTGTSLGSATAVEFGTQPAFFSDVTPTSLTAMAPAGSGTIDVTVTTPGGTSIGTSSGSFTYTTPAPAVSSLSPSTGPSSGGTLVTISGSALFGASAVHFGSAAAAIVGEGLTTLTVRAPAGASKVGVTVTTPGGTSPATSAADYTYTRPPAPVVTHVSPAGGPAAGATLVTVTGTNFAGLSGVSFGTRPAWYSQVSTTSFETIAPAGSGTVDIRAATAGGRSPAVTVDHFTYVAAVPAVSAVTPATGPASGGTTVTIKGTNLSFATAVHFGKTLALVIGDSPTSVRVRAPAGSGTVSLTVTTPAGTSPASTTARFTYG